jgi:hypothetical protein
MTGASNITSLLDRKIDRGTGQPGDGLPGEGTSGPRGIESIIEFNGLYLNVRDWVDTYLVTNIGGLDDADIRDNRDVNPGYDGETAFPALYGGRTITLTGKVYTKTLFKLRDMQQALRRAFAPIDIERPLIFRGPTPDLDSMIYCRKSQPIQMADEQRTANHFERPFQIILRASNYRWLSSLRYWHDKHFPAAAFDDIAVVLRNNGNTDAQPRFELTGPFATFTLINEENGQRMDLTAPIPAGETWIIDTAGRRMYRDSDNANRFRYLDANSDWMGFEPEENNLHLIATGLTPASHFVVYHYNSSL